MYKNTSETTSFPLRLFLFCALVNEDCQTWADQKKEEGGGDCL